jgi:hypothetical protein
MSELQIIQSTLEGAARRRRWARALRGCWVGLLVGAVFWLVALGVFKLAPIPVSVLLWAGLVGVVCPLVGLVLGGWRNPAIAETARWVDVKQNLKERMSSALEFGSEEGEQGTWRELVLRDAVNHAQEIDSKALVPFHLTKAARWAVLVLVLVAGLGFVPEYRTQRYKKQQHDAKNIKEVGKQLTDLTQRNLQAKPPALETTKKSMESVSEVGEKLSKASLTKSEALKDLSKVGDKLKDQLKEMGKDPGLKKLEQAARSGNSGETKQGLQKQMEAMQKQLGAAGGNPEAMDKLQKSLEKLQEQAKAAENKSGGATEEEKQKLSAALSQLSQQAQQAGVQLPQLDDAVQALAQNQTDRFMKDMDAATQDVEKLRDMAKKMASMQAQAEKLGKDLAEQLKNGQAQAAAATLDKLAEQLKQSNLSKEQMDKVLDEVSKALPASEEYGKVAELLKQGTKQMQSGDKQNAAKSLADASQELQKLMQQMQDAQAMMASLENLENAQQAINSGQSWSQAMSKGQCKNCNGKGCSMCQGKGYNPSGKNPGGGVGTWGQEGGEWVESGAWTQHGDNSAFDKRDQTGKGTTEREQKDLSGVLKPDKVQGQFSPGGQMPSISLKGVSIKGSSKVQYEESVAAAQSDAQAALSQEKVPRAYQGAVKDYFDDFKK